MRILSVTEAYAPFLEFGGPPVKVRALAQGLAGLGHEVTVLTADWGVEARLRSEEAASAEKSPFGWTRKENGEGKFGGESSALLLDLIESRLVDGGALARPGLLRFDQELFFLQRGLGVLHVLIERLRFRHQLQNPILALADLLLGESISF